MIALWTFAGRFERRWVSGVVRRTGTEVDVVFDGAADAEAAGALITRVGADPAVHEDGDLCVRRQVGVVEAQRWGMGDPQGIVVLEPSFHPDVTFTWASDGPLWCGTVLRARPLAPYAYELRLTPSVAAEPVAWTTRDVADALLEDAIARPTPAVGVVLDGCGYRLIDPVKLRTRSGNLAHDCPQVAALLDHLFGRTSGLRWSATRTAFDDAEKYR